MSETKTRAPKPTAAEYRKRLSQIRAMLLTGAPRGDILQYVAEKWSGAERTADYMIAEATAEIHEAAKPDKAAEIEEARAFYKLVMAQQMAAGDYRGAVTTRNCLVTLLGLAEPERVNVTLTDPAVKREAWADIVAREVENAASYAAKRN